MNTNTQFEQIGNRFVDRYYTLFDDPESRESVINFYSDTETCITVEGHQIQGLQQILLTIQNLPFQKIVRIISAVDTQPIVEEGVLIHVTGHLKADDGPPTCFSQTFLLRANGDEYYVANEIVRLQNNFIP